jgi:hypothetical protein
MLLPLGTYTERGAGWINKIPDDPLPRGVLPSSGIGAQLRGALPVGKSGASISYAAYVANGPSSVDGSGNATTLDVNGVPMPNLDLGGNVGFDSGGNSTGNFHGNPGGGGRIALFYPWKAHYDLELGISGMGSQWDNAGSLMWSAGVVDAALHVSPYFEVKGEYIYSWLETLQGTLHPSGWWIQAAYKLAGLNLELPLINNLELVGRYDTTDDGFAGTKFDRWTIGYVYYFSNTLLFQGDYEFMHSSDPTVAHNRLVFQIAYGF